MKTKLISLFASLLFAHVLSAQTDSSSTAVYSAELAPPPMLEEKLYEIFDIDKPPHFPGGESAMLRFLAENITYPDSARINNISGMVAATFIVNKDGSVSDITIIKDIGLDCGKEVMRVVSLMPRWIPGEAGGYPVRVRFTLPVRFKLE